MIVYDTESIGYYGPTIYIQYCIDRGEPVIHDIFAEPVHKTLDLIDMMVEHELIGFNLSHDTFHLARTYGVLSMLPGLSPPDPMDYRDCEQEEDAHDKFCIRPKASLDLMLHGRKGEFQSTLNQKDIIIKKIPRVLAKQLVLELHQNVKIPDLCFAKTKAGYHWRIIDIDLEGREVGSRDVDSDPTFVNLKLQFNPSAALKVIMEKVLGHDVTTLDDLPELSKPNECGYHPCNGAWLDVFSEHLWAWRNDSRRVKYARLDPVYTRELYDYFDKPPCGDDDSELAVAVGNMFWRGFVVDIEKATEICRESKEVFDKAKCNVNSPRQVLDYLLSSCDDQEALILPDTKNETLKAIMTPDWEKENPELYNKIVEVVGARRAGKVYELLSKIVEAGRMYATFKVIGTKSNRMSGGSEGYVSRGGSINPQGIKKESNLRSAFIFAWAGYSLCGGDFDGFEVSIADAVFGDDNLHSLLKEGKTFHAVFGSAMYKKTYDEIMATKDFNKNHPNGLYQRSKTGVFAWFYGAFFDKIASALWLEPEEVEEGIQALEEQFPGIRKAREEIYEHFAALRQTGGIGTKVEWVEPKEAVESFLGFKRYFKLEYEIIRALFNMAQGPSDELKEIGKGLKVVRRDRIQVGTGAVASALYAAAFNLQSAIMRTSANHRIQSPGGQMTKGVQAAIWRLQPVGVTQMVVAPFNVHDEVVAACLKGWETRVKEAVEKKIEEYRGAVPLLAMNWKSNLNNWSEV